MTLGSTLSEADPSTCAACCCEHDAKICVKKHVKQCNSGAEVQQAWCMQSMVFSEAAKPPVEKAGPEDKPSCNRHHRTSHPCRACWFCQPCRVADPQNTFWLPATWQTRCNVYTGMEIFALVSVLPSTVRVANIRAPESSLNILLSQTQ